MSFRFLCLAFVCAELTACAPRVETDIAHVSEAHGTTCSVLDLAELPLTVDHGQLVVEAAINGAPVHLIVDTGADTLLLSAAAVERLQLPRGRGQTRSLGVGGSIENENAFISSFEFGGFRLRDQSVAVAAFKSPVDGLLGATFLSAFDVEIDLAAHRLTLWGSKHCPDGFLPWYPPIATIALAEQRSGRISLPIAIGDQTLTLIFDTGAGISTMTEAAAARLGVTEADLAGDQSFEQTGVDNHPIRTRLHHFAGARVGTETLNNVAIAVAPLELEHGFDGLLGLNYLRGRRIWIDYSNRRLYVQPASILATPGS